MTNLIKSSFFFIAILLCSCANSQPKKYTTANAHAHNDYLNSKPFYLAFENKFRSIEADVFPVDGKLFVAHHKKEIQTDRTLKNLYINPILQEFASGKRQKINLLIDIKEDYKVSLPLLIKELTPLRKYLSAVGKPNYITIIISGDRPDPSQYNNYPAYIFFDHDLVKPHTAQEWKRVALVSLPFNKISGWKGEGDISADEKKKLGQVIDSAHAKGKPFRFWAAPDNSNSWKLQMELKADFIGTDKIIELAKFLRKEK